MAKKLRKHAIFFEDLSEKAQARLIEDEMRVSLHRQFAVRAVYVEKDLYGYDQDPKRQTLEQHIHAKLVDDDDLSRKSAPWLLVWNCWDKDFTTIMKEEQEDTSYKEQLSLKCITVDYPPIVEIKEGMDAAILLTVETERDRFGVKLEVAVPESISEEDKYELARKFMAKAIFQMQSIDRRYKNGCATDDAMKQVGVMMPDIIEAISKRKEYRYVNNETKGE